MSALDRIMTSIRQVILMETKLQTLADGVEKVADLLMNHEKRLIRIETLVEVAQSRLPPVDR